LPPKKVSSKSGAVHTPPDEHELQYFTVLGRALYVSQHLEMNCRAIVVNMEARRQVIKGGSMSLGDGSFAETVSKLWRQTLGQHVRCLSDTWPTGFDMGAKFDAAVAARNEIAHEVATGLEFEEAFDARIARIKDLVRPIAAADKVASALIHVLNKDPLPVAGYLSTYEDRVVEWVCAGASPETGAGRGSDA